MTCDAPLSRDEVNTLHFSDSQVQYLQCFVSSCPVFINR